MRKASVRPTIAALALAAAIALFALLPPGGAQEAAAEPSPGGKRPVVAVLDMSVVLRGSDQWRDMAEERTRRMETMRASIDNLTRQAQVLRSEFENLAPGTEESQAKARELDQALRQLQQKRQEFEQSIAQSYAEATRTLFDAVRRVVADYAEQNGIDLVLKQQQIDLDEPESPGQNIMLATTEVLYAAPELDISATVVERLNAEYPGPIEVQ